MTMLRGIVASGVGQGARFMSLAWVGSAVHQWLGFDPYPGTLNVRLVDADMLVRWRKMSKEGALLLTPPAAEQCGGRLIPITLARNIPAAVIVPDVTRYGDHVLEVVAAVHLRSRLGLQDGDLLTLEVRRLVTDDRV
jgi:CTP-dependent riboflavin kinase